jgi:hypothetical protein
MRLSRGFICALIGVAMTLLAWYGPWAWPAWPAFMAVDLLFGPAGYGDYSYSVRATILVALIMLNVSFWGLIAYGASTMLRWRARPS